jgi:hypothetical protein
MRRLSPKQRRLAYLAVIVAGLAFAAGWSPPAKTVHTFTKTSDYHAERERGCTNSGEGCHGSEEDYVDFNAYHPDTDCTVCHRYDGVGCIPCHKPSLHECAECHDGTMEGAADAVRLTDPYPRGHYRESTHTAMGTDMSKVVKTAEGGEARLACKECHSRDLREAHTGVPVVAGSSYGPDVGCGECHNDARAQGLAEVRSEWKKRRCEDCHGLDSSSPMHSYDVAPAVESTGPTACGASGPGCHVTRDLHAIHPDRPRDCTGSDEKGEPGCHDLSAESHKPPSAGCGKGTETCHAAYLGDGFSHDKDRSVHSPTSGGPAADTAYQGIACGSCHFMEPDGASLVVEHALASSAWTLVPNNGCRDCHNHPASQRALLDRWAARDTDDSCYVCHDAQILDSPHERDLAAVHTISSGSYGCASTGGGCHPTSDLSAIGSPEDGAIHGECLDCHDRTASGGNMAYSPGRTTCGAGRDCHASDNDFDPETSYHPGDGERIDGTDSAHHEAGAEQRDDLLADSASGVTEECGSCHSMSLGTEHTRPNTGLPATGVCMACHDAGVTAERTVKTDWPAKDTDEACAACHGEAAAHGSPDDLHRAIQYDHANRVATNGCARAACHPTADVRILHADLGCTPAGCHTDTGDIRGERIMSCGGTDGLSATSCHTASNRHQGAGPAHRASEFDQFGVADPGACVSGGCHTTTDVRDLHTADHCYTAGCHVAGGPTYMSCGGADGQQHCHTTSDRHGSDEASHQATQYDDADSVSPTACAKAGCHPSADVRTLHATTSCETSGCHVTGGPTYMSCGGTDGLAGSSCHTSSDRHRSMDASHNAIEYNDVGAQEASACAKAGCHATVDVRALHTPAGCETVGCHVAGGPTYMSCGGVDGQQNCHTTSLRHFHLVQSHQATELGNAGLPQPGACLGGACHATADVIALHAITGCDTTGCHSPGGPTYMTCGGPASPSSCHSPPPPATCFVVPAPPRARVDATATTDATPTSSCSTGTAGGESADTTATSPEETREPAPPPTADADEDATGTPPGADQPDTRPDGPSEPDESEPSVDATGAAGDEPSAGASSDGASPPRAPVESGSASAEDSPLTPHGKPVMGVKEEVCRTCHSVQAASSRE